MNPARQVRRPLTALALCFSAGLLAARLMHLPPLPLLSAAAFLLAWLCRRTSAPVLYLTCTCLAAAYGAIETAPQRTAASAWLHAAGQPPQCVSGRILDDPVDASGQSGFLLKTDLPSREVLRVYLRNPATPPAYGERWTLTGRITGYGHLRNGVSGYLRADGAQARRLCPAAPSLKGVCLHLRERAAGILQHAGRDFPEQTRLLLALLLGYREQMQPELFRMFSRTGTLHIFAISGLHVGVMAAILIAGLKTAGIARPAWGLLLIPALFLYVVSTGMKPSALRAFTMAAVYFAAPLAGRRPDAPSAIALAALVLLLINPGQISAPGFLLSFMVVSGIVMVHGETVRRINGLYRKGWEAPLRPLAGAHPVSALARGIGLLMLTSLAAWLFSMPLTARFFNTLSPVALIGNLFIIPLTFMIVLTGCLTLIAAPVFPPAALLFAQANGLFITALIGGIRYAEALPGAWFFVRAPSPAVMAFWYAGLTLLFAGPDRLKKGSILLVLLSLLLWGAQDLHPRHEITVVELPRSATLLRLPPNRWILVSCGDAFDTDQTVRMLQKQGVNRLEALVVSDPRADPDAVRQFTRLFRPREIRTADEHAPPRWAAGQGTVLISSGSSERPPEIP